MPNSAGREQVMTAFETLLGTPAGFKTVTRRMKLWTDVESGLKPWLGIQEQPDNVVQGSEDQPGATTMNLNLFIYIDDGKDPTTTPITVLNNLIDAVETAIKPPATMSKQTMSGLVSHVWIEGTVHKEPGDIDGDGIAIIPVKILIP